MATNISGIGIANAIGFNNFKMGGIASLKPIASYRCYDKTNDDSDKDILKDLSGNGHDIQLFNFEFAEGSGYGKYAVDFTTYIKISSRATFTLTNTKVNITEVITAGANFIETTKNSTVSSYKIKVNGLQQGQILKYRTASDTISFLMSKDGIYVLPEVINLNNAGFQLNFIGKCNITIEQIPDYPGALVSDGVDDYGLCENFPILTKEKGYTVCAIRNHINNKGTLVSKRTTRSSEGAGDNIGAFQVERYYGEQPSVFSFGAITKFNQFSNDIFIFQKSNYYCNLPISVGIYKDYVDLTLFSYYKNYTVGSFALYALEIYDRDLTDEEIAKVKARMIAEYEEKTGNKYEEETV